MKLISDDTDYKSNFDKSSSISFDVGEATVLIDILRNYMYEHKVKTLVQEYLCNARDANREVRQARPIEVKFPNGKDPNFSVRDYGPGITDERMKIFVLYGASSKRSTNTQTGGFGLGSKSAWSYTDSFTLITYIDGIKKVYLAHTGENKKGSINLMSESVTDEINGTEIIVTSKSEDFEEFGNAIIRATMFWDESEYPVFKESPDLDVLEEARRLGSPRFMGTNISGMDTSDYTEYGDREIQIIIDGIPYPMPNKIVDTKELNELKVLTSNDSGLNIFIPNGLVEVAASREKIADSESSKKALKEIISTTLNNFKKAFSRWDKSIVDVKSLMEAKSLTTDFDLSSTNYVDNVRLIDGFYKIRTGIEVEGYRFFNTTNIDEQTSFQGSFDVVGNNKYYMSRSGAAKRGDIKNWISDNRIGSVNLVTVLAQKEIKKKDDDGKEYSNFKRDKDLQLELIASLERLGFKNIEPLITKTGSTKKLRIVEKKPKKMVNTMDSQYVDIFEIDELREGDKPYVYWIGNARIGLYDHVYMTMRGLRSLGLIERGIRVTNSRKHIIPDGDIRFIEFNEFMDRGIELSKENMLRILLKTDLLGSSLNSNVFNNIKDNLNEGDTDKLFKFSNKLAALDKVENNYRFNSVLLNIVKRNQEYEIITNEVKSLKEYLSKYIPLAMSNYSKSDHMKEYLKWGLSKADEAGLNISNLF